MTTTLVTPTHVASYSVLPLQIATIQGTANESRHFLYVRPHDPKEPDPDSPRSLFTASIPIDSTEAHYRALFSLEKLGGVRVERVVFASSRPTRKAAVAGTHSGKNRKRKRAASEDVPADTADAAELPDVWERTVHPSGSSAVIVFVDRTSKEVAWRNIKKVIKSGEAPVWGVDLGGKTPVLGSNRYLRHHALCYPGSSVLQPVVDAYMTSFSASEIERARTVARTRAVPDADGFITVTRGGRVGPARLDEANEALEKERKRTRMREEATESFYRFQLREKNKERAGELVRAFAEDRKRVEEMRKARRGTFRPM